MKHLLLFVLLLTLSCNAVKEGVVEEKIYEPEDTYWALIPLVMSSGKATTVIMIPYLMYDDEDYVLKIRNGDKERTVYTDKKVYDSVSVGGYIVFNKTDKVALHDTPERLARATESDKENYPQRR